MRGALIAGFAGALFSITGLVLVLVLLDTPLNLFVAIPSAIVMAAVVALWAFQPKKQEAAFRVTEVVELEKKEK